MNSPLQRPYSSPERYGKKLRNVGGTSGAESENRSCKWLPSHRAQDDCAPIIVPRIWD